MGTAISKKVESLLQKALLNDGKIDATEAKGIAKATKSTNEKSAVAQRLMDDGFTPSTTERKDVAKLLGQADLPKTNFNYSVQKASRQTVVTHVEVDGVTFKMALREGQHPDPATLKAIAKEVNDANKLISDPKQKLTEVAIANGATTRMATFNGKPMLVLSPENANKATAAHESGHAVTESFRVGKNDDVMMRTADIYNRLMATKSVKGTLTDSDGTKTKAEIPSGMWPFDPTQWSKGGSAEHPWDDPDEFFASALEAYRTDRAGLEKAIAKFEKLDPAGAKPAKEMLALLDDLSKGTAVTKPKLSAADEKAARESLATIKNPSKVEDTIDSMLNEALKLALKP